MPFPSAIVIGIAALTAGVDWLAVAWGLGRLERRAKPAVIVLLVLAVLLADPAASPRSLLLAVALGASITGDLLLLPPPRFVLGLAAFLIAHLAYVAVFLLMGVQGAFTATSAELAGAALVGVAAILWTAGRPILAGAARSGMGRPVAAYLGAICVMAIAATATGSGLAAAGAWLFVASDALLGWDRFVAAPPAPPASPAASCRRRLRVMVTYHAAQVLLVLAVLSVPLS